MEIDSTERIRDALTLMQPKLAVLSTIGGDGSPDAATVYFIYDKELNFYFMCSQDSLKFKNIIRSPKVSLTIYSEHPPKTIQIKGDAEPLSDKEKLKELQDTARDSNVLPPIKQITDISGDSKVAVIKLKPTWMRLGDFDIYREHNMFHESSDSK